MVGYYKEPELTADAFTEDGFLKTGDRGEIDTDGRLRITGRVKELFKTSKGKYVAPAPIENIINTDSNVELSCVSGSGYPTTHAVVQLAEDLLPKLDEASIREQITGDLATLLARVNGQVEAFEKLGFIVVSGTRWTVEGGHLTPTMKMKRPVIEALYQEQLDAWYTDGRKVIWEV
jgi:long-subunit acyl-CoA synthetase (AMP-forming)